MVTAKHRRGKRAEKQALFFLISKGFSLVARNYSSRYGEIDLIVQSRTHIVFVEVKMRNDTRHGTPQEYVTLKKQEKIILTSQQFLQQYPTYRSHQPRYDVVGITPKEITWVPNAFSCNLKKAL